MTLFERLDDTIAAISSPAGPGLRGVIRLSGPDAWPLAAKVFRGNEDMLQSAGHRRICGRLSVDGGGTIQAEAYLFRAPASYTRQDVVELHTLGSPPLLADLLDQLCTAGARLADPGEFTARAYFNGAMDLTRVEGVAAAINARSDGQLRASEALLRGELSRRTHDYREQLTDLLALVEAQIDFVDEPIEFVSGAHVVETVQRVATELQTLLRAAPELERLEVLPEVLLVGPPNVGKSTLFNRLTGLDRAIRSAVAGTTRDVLRAAVSWPRGEFTLSDSAGLRTVRAESDSAEGPAQSSTRRAVRSADLVILLLDTVADPVSAAGEILEDLPPGRTCVVLNKVDLAPPSAAAATLASIDKSGRPLAISALTGEGLDELQAVISDALFAAVESHGADLLALTHRQRNALGDAVTALDKALEICRENHAIASRWELLALEIRAAVSALSLLTGEVTTEELLDRIFARFCIGK